MILMAEDPSGKLYFVQPGEKIQPGSGVCGSEAYTLRHLKPHVVDSGD
jgi:hypothetical protein